jgi:hypothetical protein
MFKISDLAHNLSSDTEFTPYDTSTHSHGTLVASIIGAQGDNSIGMTGMLWRTKLGYFNAKRPSGTDSLLYGFLAIQRAGVAGYPVINISRSVYWKVVKHRLPLSTGNADSNHTDSETVIAVRDNFEAATVATTFAGHYPLYVVAAGNDGIDAWWSGFPAAKADSSFADDSALIVVVAGSAPGSNPNGTLSSFSDTGRLVNLAAPGSGVTSLDSVGNYKTVSGTSFATAFVSGAAGQLATFDPTLAAASSPSTVDSLRSYIIRGAADGGRKAGRYYILNAYDALKRAAGRRGAPLCGNPVSFDTSSSWTPLRFFILRQQGVVDTVNMPTSSGIYGVPHGGKKLFAGGPSDFLMHSFGWTPAGWVDNGIDTAGYNDPQGQWGSFRNLPEGLNHDGDTAFMASSTTIYVGNSTIGYNVLVTLPSGGPYDVVLSIAPGMGEVFATLSHRDDFGQTITTVIYKISLATGVAEPLQSYADAGSIYLSDDGSLLAVQYGNLGIYGNGVMVDYVDLTQPGWDVINTGTAIAGGTTIGQEAVGPFRRLPLKTQANQTHTKR